MEVKYKLSKDLIIENTKNKLEIFELSQNKLFTFNKIASEILKELKNWKTKKELILNIKNKYFVSYDKVNKELSFFLKKMQFLKIVKINRKIF